MGGVSAIGRVFALESASGGSSAFPRIDRRVFVQDLLLRVGDPRRGVAPDPGRINQQASSLCGPASFFYCLIQDKPDVYINYVMDLYQTGRARLGSIDIAPGGDCRSYDPGGQISPVDWVALASLRDSENSVFDYQSVDDETAGITMPHSMARWFRSVGYTGVDNETNTFFTKDPDDLSDAGGLVAHGHRVCLFINAQMLEGNPTDRSMFPNHWVVLKSVNLSGDKVTLKVWTWGSVQTAPSNGVPVDADPFTRNFYGYVAALPT